MSWRTCPLFRPRARENDFHPYLPQAEWGGMKMSGNGRELGPTGLAEYQEHKHVYHNIAPGVTGWFAQ